MENFKTLMLQEMQIRNYSERTISTYLSFLKKLSEYYRKEPAKITIGELKSYIHKRITEDSVSVSFVNQMISAFRLFKVDVLKLEWDDLCIKRPRTKKILPVVLSQEEVKIILNNIKNIKHRAIITTIYSGGLRISELINLKIYDIDSKRMQIRIWDSKGNKDRTTLLSKNTLNQLKAYYLVYRPKRWLFEGVYRKQYSTTSIRKILGRAVTKSGIRKHVTVHTLRHSFATHLLEQGVNIQIIQRLLGHRSVHTTCKYLHVQQYAIDKVISPLDFINE